MRFMVILKATKDSEAGVMPKQELIEEMGRFNQELASAGVLVAADGLYPSSTGARVRFDGKKRTVIDGPFAETKELVAGFWILQTRSLEEAVEWVKRFPTPPDEPTELEIRRAFDDGDFDGVPTPEQLEHLRAQVEGAQPS